MRYAKRFTLPAVLLFLALSAHAAESSAVPAPKFTSKPAVTAAGKAFRIAFAADRAADVEVAVLDAGGQVVRHLAAGLLGEHAPAPFKAGSLAQELVWDGTDDAGKPAANGPFSARVRLGSQAKLEKNIGWGERSGYSTYGLAVGGQGELYVLSSTGMCLDMRVFDKTGKYLRTIIPYSAKTPKERTAPVGDIELDGARMPIVFNAQGRTTYPMTTGVRQQNMAWHPKGYLVMFSALGTLSDHGPPRHLLAIDAEGGAPAGARFVGPQIRAARGFLGGSGEASAPCFEHLALSPDGEYLYVSSNTYGSNRLDAKPHAVYRVKWSDANLGSPFIGDGTPGSDDAHFKDPTGLATDAAGNIYVCDWGNNRVMVFDKDAKLRAKFAADKPHQICVHPKTGDIYVLSCGIEKRWAQVWGAATALAKFSPLAKGEPKQVAAIQVKAHLMALDPTSDPPRLWIDGGRLIPVVDKGATLEAGQPLTFQAGILNGNGPDLGYLAGDPARNRAYVYLYNANKPSVLRLDLDTGKAAPFCNGTAMALDRNGNVYAMDGRGDQSTICRYAPDGKPLAFSGTGSHKIKAKGWRGYGPFKGLGGIAVDPRGDIYVMRNSNYGGANYYGGYVDQYGPDGVHKKAVIEGLGYGDSGLGVDAAGNIYVGSNLKPASSPLPNYLAGKVPDKGWSWYKDADKREAPWRYIYYNPYLFFWGAAFKFGPEGGTFYGQNANVAGDAKKYGTPSAFDFAKNAPAGAESLRSACLAYEVKVAGAQWHYQGVGIIPGSGDPLTPDPGCVCYNSQLAVDPYGRSYLPNVFRFSVERLDTAGNVLERIGQYGNADDGGGTEIRLAWPAMVSWGGEKLFVADATNQRVVVIRFDWSAEELCPVAKAAR